jgi:hypothetical protein
MPNTAALNVLNSILRREFPMQITPQYMVSLQVIVITTLENEGRIGNFRSPGVSGVVILCRSLR